MDQSDKISKNVRNNNKCVNITYGIRDACYEASKNDRKLKDLCNKEFVSGYQKCMATYYQERSKVTIQKD
jgi:hypothetical protein